MNNCIDIARGHGAEKMLKKNLDCVCRDVILCRTKKWNKYKIVFSVHFIMPVTVIQCLSSKRHVKHFCNFVVELELFFCCCGFIRFEHVPRECSVIHFWNRKFKPKLVSNKDGWRVRCVSAVNQWEINPTINLSPFFITRVWLRHQTHFPSYSFYYDNISAWRFAFYFIEFIPISTMKTSCMGLVSSHDFLVRSHDFLIVSHRFLVRSHNLLVFSDWISIQLDQQNSGKRPKNRGYAPKIAGNQPINRGKPCIDSPHRMIISQSYVRHDHGTVHSGLEPIVRCQFVRVDDCTARPVVWNFK